MHGRALLLVLSVIAGATDTIGFLGLGGLFTAHVTGNLVILAAHLVSGISAQVAVILSVPVFMLMLVLTRLFAAGCEAIGLAPLKPLLLLQLLLLAGFLVLGMAAGPHVDPNAAIAILAGMFGTLGDGGSERASCSFALPGAPTTAVMTSNVAPGHVEDIGTLVVARSPVELAGSRQRAERLPGRRSSALLPGCGLGAACEAMFGLRSLAVPTGLALLAFFMSVGRMTEAHP